MNLALLLMICPTCIQEGQATWRIVTSAMRDGQQAIQLFDSEGSPLQQLTTGQFDLLPKWSPDGKRIAFLGLREQDFALADAHRLAFHWYLYTMDADGQHQNRVSVTPVSVLFDWSPDGNRFLFASSWEDPANRGIDGIVSSAIYVLNEDGTELKRLTPIEGLDGHPVWSPDGSHIAFCSTRNGNRDIFLMRDDGSDVRQLTTDSTDDTDPVWAPDGERILFASMHEQEASGVYLIHADGSRKSRVTDMGRPIAWSPDESQILIANEDRLFLVDPDGSNLRQVTDDQGRALDGQFSSDGKRVFYRWNAGADWEIWSVGVDGEDREKHFESPGLTGFSISASDANR